MLSLKEKKEAKGLAQSEWVAQLRLEQKAAKGWYALICKPKYFCKRARAYIWMQAAASLSYFSQGEIRVVGSNNNNLALSWNCVYLNSNKQIASTVIKYKLPFTVKQKS